MKPKSIALNGEDLTISAVSNLVRDRKQELEIKAEALHKAQASNTFLKQAIKENGKVISREMD